MPDCKINKTTSKRGHAVCQVGCWEGQSACWLLENVCCAAESKLVCIDTWDGEAQYGSAAQVPLLLNTNHYSTNQWRACLLEAKQAIDCHLCYIASSLSAMQSWGMSKQEHNGKKIFQRFMDNIATTGHASRVTVMQQPSLTALAGVISTCLEKVDVSKLSDHALHNAFCSRAAYVKQTAHTTTDICQYLLLYRFRADQSCPFSCKMAAPEMSFCISVSR